MELTDLPVAKVKSERTALKEVPSMIGVYLFVKKGKPHYVGKATNLKARLISHFEGARIDAKERRITQEADEIQYVITNSDFKALILESHLIKTYLPHYNVRWKDGKSYLYIKITVKDEYPKVYPTRKEFDKKSLFFGPFPSHKSVDTILKEIRRIFPFCTQKKMGNRSCFYSKIGLCNPCPNEIVNLPPGEKPIQKRLYRKNVRKVIRILEGDTEDILKGLYQELKEAKEDQTRYEEAIILRNKILRFERLLSDQIYFQNETSEGITHEDKLSAVLHLLALHFPQLATVNRIECYDISNMSMKDSTASMVVATDGLIDKSQYRKFKIKKPRKLSDFHMLEETMRRRFRNDWTRPDLIVIDGGKPQVRIIRQVLAEDGVNIPVIGIAKNPDRLIMGVDNLPMVRPALNNPGFSLIRQLRDESHRFARKYHLYLRSSNLPG